jgi:hypothetical protein
MQHRDYVYKSEETAGCHGNFIRWFSERETRYQQHNILKDAITLGVLLQK